MKYGFILCAFAIIAVAANSGYSLSGGEILGETPVFDIPSEMSWEEYRDANRRVSMGLLFLAVPIPGTLHFYAEEDKKGWFCVGAAGLGLASIAAGALLRGDEVWPESDYELTTIGGNRYEMIPRILSDDKVEYKLRLIEQREELTTGGAILIGTGAVLIIGQLIYDWIDGLATIERKRDTVRYKYGIGGYGARIEPRFDKGIGLTMTLE